MKTTLIKELCIPIALLGILASIVFPVPPFLLDILLVANLLFALALFVTTLHITEPLKLSSLPTILLLATLFRLCLNISTTRLILSGGDVGETVRAFGSFVVGGNVTVGFIVFAVITLIQFMVIAKGAERVAEVSARFALDAMPGKQMSIDADVRAGLFDGDTARKKRQEVQIESRFYGALDGAMKFVKGDAIAGILIVLINVVGGFILGVGFYKMTFSSAISKYTLLSIGDGLLAQIPSLLNSLAAGLVVTRVPSTQNNSVSVEMLQQLSQSRTVCILVGVFSCLLGLLPTMPRFALFAIGGGIIVIGWLQKPKEELKEKTNINYFRPTIAPVILIRGSRDAFERLGNPDQIVKFFEEIREAVYDRTGILITRPELSLTAESVSFELLIRDFVKGKIEPAQTSADLFHYFVQKISYSRLDLLDDAHSRRLLDFADTFCPELVSSIIPQLITVTQFTEILKLLSRDGISLKPIAVLLQAIAESAPKTQNERQLLEEIRQSLGSWVVKSVTDEQRLKVIFIDSAADLAFMQAEKGKGIVRGEYIRDLIEQIKIYADQIDCLVASKGARRIISEFIAGTKVKVLAFEEISEDIELEKIAEITFSGEKQLYLIDKLAA